MLNLDFNAGKRAATPLRGQLLPSKELASEAFCHSKASGLKWLGLGVGVMVAGSTVGGGGGCEGFFFKFQIHISLGRKMFCPSP